MRNRRVLCSMFCLGILAGGFAARADDDLASLFAPAVPPPAAPPKFGAAKLEELAAPIALHPDPLIAVILPAAALPLEIVQAARFVRVPANVPSLDEQPWDANVKAVARIPAVIEKMAADLAWTMDLGQAFVHQKSELMDTIQFLRAKARMVGALQDTPQQTVVAKDVVVEQVVQNKVVYVTNTVVEIKPANPSVVYVPVYAPTVYYVAPPPPGPKPPPPVVTFGVGVAVGVVIVNNHPPPPLWHYPPPPPYRPPGGPPPPGYHPPTGAPPPGAHPRGAPPPGYRPPGGAPPPGGGAKPPPSGGAKPPPSGGAKPPPSGGAKPPPSGGAKPPPSQSAFKPPPGGGGASSHSYGSRGSFSRGGRGGGGGGRR